MPNISPTIMGKAKLPSFAQGSSPSSSSSSSSKASNPLKGNLPIIFGLLFLGAGLIFFMRSKSGSPTMLGAPLTVVPTTDADASNVQNMIQAVKALTGGVAANLPVGGIGGDLTGTNSPSPSETGTGAPMASVPIGYSNTADIINRVWKGQPGIGQNIEDVLAATTPQEQRMLAGSGVFGDPAHPPLGRNSFTGSKPLSIDWSLFSTVTSGYGVDPTTNQSVPVVRAFKGGEMVSEQYLPSGTPSDQVYKVVESLRSQFGVL